MAAKLAKQRSWSSEEYDPFRYDEGSEKRKQHPSVGAKIAKQLSSSSEEYEPSPRYRHIAGCIDNNHIVQGGKTEKRKEHSRSVVDVFDTSLEKWKQESVRGDLPKPGTFSAACASSQDGYFYCFGGYDGTEFFNTLYELDPKSLMWTLLSSQNEDGAPMPKRSCGMAIFGDRIVIANGHGIPRETTAPGSFIKDRLNKGRGWTNELHIYDLSKGVWSCPDTSGQLPPPCSTFTFTAIDKLRAVMFGGSNGDQGRISDVFTFDISTMNWKKLSKSEPWPEERNNHAVCCLNYGQRFPQLLMTGGLDRQHQPLADVWILDMGTGKWSKVNVTLKARWCHSLTALSLGPGLTEVMQFGGSSKTWTKGSTQPKLSESTLLQFRLEECSGKSQWELLSSDDWKLGSQQRLVNKFRNTLECWHQYSSKREGKLHKTREELEIEHLQLAIKQQEERTMMLENELYIEREKREQAKFDGNKASQAAKEAGDRIISLENQMTSIKGRMVEVEEERGKLVAELQDAHQRAHKLQQQLDEAEEREHQRDIALQESATHTDDLNEQCDSYEDGVKGWAIAKKMVTITNEEQDIEWVGYGLKLHIPRNSLPEDVNESKLYITVSCTTKYQLPTDQGILVSAIYSFNNSIKDKKMCRPVTVQIQYSTSTSAFPLLVHSNETAPPFKFSAVEGGAVYNNGYCSFKLDHFFSFGVWLKWFVASLYNTLKPCAVIYYTNIQQTSFDFHLYVVPGLDAILTEIDHRLREKKFREGNSTYFDFDKNETAIKLILSNEKVNGWSFTHLNFDTMQIGEISRMERVLIPFQVKVNWSDDEGKGICKELLHTVKLSGTKGVKLAVISPIECTGTRERSASGTAMPQIQDFAIFQSPNLSQLMEVIGVDLKEDWKAVGLGLGLENPTLKKIEAENHKIQDCMQEVFTEWKNQATSDYSWVKLAKVISSRSVNKPTLLCTMWDQLSQPNL